MIGEDPMRVEAIVAKLRRAASARGPGGIFTLALAAIDLALWDIKGKALGQTLNAMAGGARDRVNTYASAAPSCARTRWTTCATPGRGWSRWASSR